MSKFCIVDFRMRKVEKEYIKSLGYKIIEVRFNLKTYDEISAHPDIYYVKVGNMCFASPGKVIDGFNMLAGNAEVGNAYPEDVPYNIALVGRNAVHNFNYTDKNLLAYLKGADFNFVHVNQGYSKCSTCVLTEDACIVSDIGIARALIDAGIDVLYVSEPDIKLLKRTNSIFIDEERMRFEYSDMTGFIGGAMVRLGDTVILFGDKCNLVNGGKIQKFIENKGLKFHDFEGLDIIDYGGVIEVEKDE